MFRVLVATPLLKMQIEYEREPPPPNNVDIGIEECFLHHRGHNSVHSEASKLYTDSN
jgi:hypothetical protein